jgi:prepilin-type N-terminal cleavage/methylation domain-containing protein
MQRGIKRIMGKIKKRAGFTLIEVIVALGIFLIVILALVVNYYSYYNSVKQMTYKAIGQNLAEVLLEDVRSLQVGILDSLVKGEQYPSEIAWQKYKYSDSHPGCYEVSETPDLDIPDAIPFPPDQDHTVDPETGFEIKYDSGEIDSSYRLQKVEAIFGVKESGTINPALLVGLPNNIVITPVYYSDEDTYDYTVVLNKETFPYYKRRIVIEDLNSGIGQPELKIYKIEVTISWNDGQQNITVTGEKSFRQ